MQFICITTQLIVTVYIVALLYVSTTCYRFAERSNIVGYHTTKYVYTGSYNVLHSEGEQFMISQHKQHIHSNNNNIIII